MSHGYSSHVVLGMRERASRVLSGEHRDENAACPYHVFTVSHSLLATSNCRVVQAADNTEIKLCLLSSPVRLAGQNNQTKQVHIFGHDYWHPNDVCFSHVHSDGKLMNTARNDCDNIR